MSKKKLDLFAKVRTYEPAPYDKKASVWIIARDGSAQSWKMWGEMIPEAAEELVQALGLPIERDHTKYPDPATGVVIGGASRRMKRKKAEEFAHDEVVFDDGLRQRSLFEELEVA